MTNLRKLVLTVLVLLMCSVFFSTALLAQEKVSLRVAWWGSQDRHNRTLGVIELFEKEYPYIEIYPEYAVWNDYWVKLNTQAAGKNLPDVIQQDYAYLSEWATRGLVLPLDDYIVEGVIDLSDVAENQIAPGKVGDKIYAINLGTNSLGMLYDPELFEKAGIPFPEAGWTWNDFKEIAIKLKNELGIYGAEGITKADAQVFKVWLMSHGYWLYSDDGKSLGYEDDRLFSDWANLLLDLQNEGAIPSIETEVARGALGIEDMFLVTQESAMALAWSNYLVAVTKAANERPLKLALMPKAPIADAKPANYLKASQFFSVTSQSQHPKEAVMFIDFFTNSFEANKILFAERGVPISSKIQELLFPYLEPAQKEMFSFIKLAENNSLPAPPPDPPGHTDIIYNVWDPIIEQVMYGKITPEEAAAEFRKEATRILQQQ